MEWDSISKGVTLPQFAFPDSSRASVNHHNNILDDIKREVAEKQKREEDYKQNVLEALLGIERNTASIATLVTLIQQNNDKQDEIIGLLNQVFEMSKSQTKEEAESKYRQFMKKLSDFNGDVGTIQALQGFANTAWTVLQPMFTGTGT
ncbi:hypothetical protein [Brevibacillus porteri]|uniref:hypothetical protein n=1 Tax=Brevibacillus porteri TaxID=2126350 RepID=UPI003D1D25EA